MAETMAKRGVSRPTLSASELRDLIAYLKSVEPKRAPSQASIIPGRIDEGRALFGQKQCIKCHNLQGGGGNVGPDLGKRGLQSLHIHLSGIDYGPKGEKKHLPLKEADLKYKELFRALIDAKAGGRILCESPLMEEDALVMQKAYRRLAAKKDGG